MKRYRLQNRVSKYTPKKFYKIDPRMKELKMKIINFYQICIIDQVFGSAVLFALVPRL